MRVLTFNVFDLPPVKLFFVKKTLSEGRDVRLPEILKVIQGNSSQDDGWDLLLLQELWSQRYRKMFREQSGYEYCVDEMGQEMPECLSVIEGAKHGFGHGLMILSRYPVKKTWKTHFTANGQWRHVDDGEVSVRKGAIAGLIENPKLGRVVVVNSHLVARYEDHQYKKQRVSQFGELLHFCEEVKKETACPLVLGGDLNFGPWLGPQTDKLKAGIDLFERLTKDTRVNGRRLLHCRSAYVLPQMATYCGKNNFYVSAETDGQQIIDHIFCTDELCLSEPVIRFDRPICSDQKIPFSDHYALEVKIEANG